MSQTRPVASLSKSKQNMKSTTEAQKQMTLTYDCHVLPNQFTSDGF